MALTRKLKDGTIGVANTVYIPQDADDVYKKRAKENKSTKSKEIVKVLLDDAKKVFDNASDSK